MWDWKKTQEFIQKVAHLLEVRIEKVPTAFVYFDDRKYRIVLPEGLDEESLAKAFAHEFAHIVRGDLFFEEKEHELANIAQDVVINTVLGIDSFRFIDGKELKGWTDEEFRQVFGEEAPSYEAGWRALYKFMEGKVKKIPAGYWMDIHRNIEQERQQGQEQRMTAIKPEDREKAREVRDKLILATTIFPSPEKLWEIVREELRKAEQEWKKLQEWKEKVSKHGQAPAPLQVPIKKLSALERLIRRKIDTIAESEHHYEYQYVRKPKYHWIGDRVIVQWAERERHREGKAMLIIVDVSGSYIDVAREKVLPAVRYAKRRGVHMDVILFDDEAIMPKSEKEWQGGGSGARIEPVFELLRRLRKKYPVIICVSNYEILDLDLPSNEEIKSAIKRELRKYGDEVYVEDWSKAKVDDDLSEPV
jgi:hypothetical protein